MKRIGNLYHLVYDLGNLKLAIISAAKGKEQRSDVKRVLADVDGSARILQNMLMNMQYNPTPPIKVTIHSASCNKEREISKPQFFPDLCIQRALNQILMPILMKGMYEYSYGSMPGRGNLQAKRTVEKWVRKDYKNTKYCLIMDIDNFFQSINLGVLKNAFRKRIKDYQLLWLIDTIIDVQDKGLPIGYYTSPWFCHFLLQELDHKIKEKFGATYYIRYVDDMVIFGRNKKKLHKIRVMIADYLRSIGACLNGNWQVFKYQKNRVLDFVGYRFYRTHTLVRKRIAKRMRHRINKAKKRLKNGKMPTYLQAAGIMSYLGWTKYGNCYNFYRVNLKPYFDKNLRILKEVIRYEMQKRSNARAG